MWTPHQTAPVAPQVKGLAPHALSVMHLVASAKLFNNTVFWLGVLHDQTHIFDFSRFRETNNVPSPKVFHCSLLALPCDMTARQFVGHQCPGLAVQHQSKPTGCTGRLCVSPPCHTCPFWMQTLGCAYSYHDPECIVDFPYWNCVHIPLNV